MVGIVLAVAIAELLVGFALWLDNINDCRFCVLRIESGFIPTLDVGASCAVLLGTFDAGSIVGAFRDAPSSDNIDRELSPRSKESRTLGPGTLLFCGGGDGPF